MVRRARIYALPQFLSKGVLPYSYLICNVTEKWLDGKRSFGEYNKLELHFGSCDFSYILFASCF